jgi:hypothetical protein
MMTVQVLPTLVRLWRSTAVRLALVAFVVYNINLRPISSADTFPTRYLPIALLTGHGFQLDQFDFLMDSRYPLPGAETSGVPYYLQFRRGHYLSTYPVMPAILAVPVYALPVALGLTSAPSRPGSYSRTEIVGTFLSKITASAATALSVALVYLALLLLTDRRSALWLTLVYAFATSAWSVSSQGMWQTSFSGPLLAATMLCLLRARTSESRRQVVWAGVWVAIAVACRPTVGIFALLFTAYVFQRHRRHFLAFLVVPTVIGALLLAYNVYYFGNVMGGYTGTYVAPYDFSPSQVAFGTYGLLLSANRGLLVFSPVLLFGFIGMGRTLIRRDDALFVHTALGVIATILFYSTFTAWYGTFSFSYRYLADLLPMFVLFIPATWAWVTASPGRRAGFATLAVGSVAIQVVGSFFYPCGWYRSPVRDPAAMARIFDWRDLEVVQCVRNGPVYPDGLRLIRPGPRSPGSP